LQEEVENRTVNLAISTGKLSARLVLKAALKGLAVIKGKLSAGKDQKPVGKQTIKELIGQNQGVSNIDIAKTDLSGFEKYARKYGVDYAITKDRSVVPPKYLVFFKARDADAMTAAFNAYSAEILTKSGRPSVRKALQRIAAAAKDIPVKVMSREKQRQPSR
jgi:hypothetical protein